MKTLHMRKGNWEMFVWSDASQLTGRKGCKINSKLTKMAIQTPMHSHFQKDHGLDSYLYVFFIQQQLLATF